MLKVYREYLLKDLRCFCRERKQLISIFALAVLLSFVGSAGFRLVGYSAEQLRDLAPGILWLLYLFISTSVLRAAFEFETEDLAVLGLATKNLGAFFLAKFSSNFILMLLVEMLIFFLLGLFLEPSLFEAAPGILLITLLFTLGFSALGTLMSAVAAVAQGSQLMLPLIFFPICVPEVLAGMEITRNLFKTGQIAYSGFPSLLLFGFGIVSVVMSWALFPSLMNSTDKEQ